MDKQHISLMYCHNECSKGRLHKHILQDSISLGEYKLRIFELSDLNNFLMDKRKHIFQSHKSFLMHKLHTFCLYRSNNQAEDKRHMYHLPTYMALKLDKGIGFSLYYKFGRLDKQHILLKIHSNMFLKDSSHNIFRSRLGFELDTEYKLIHSRKVINQDNKRIFGLRNHNSLFLYKFHTSLR